MPKEKISAYYQNKTKQKLCKMLTNLKILSNIESKNPALQLNSFKVIFINYLQSV